jgi:hypothetical protein
VPYAKRSCPSGPHDRSLSKPKRMRAYFQLPQPNRSCAFGDVPRCTPVWLVRLPRAGDGPSKCTHPCQVPADTTTTLPRPAEVQAHSPPRGLLLGRLDQRAPPGYSNDTAIVLRTPTWYPRANSRVMQRPCSGCKRPCQFAHRDRFGSLPVRWQASSNVAVCSLPGFYLPSKAMIAVLLSFSCSASRACGHSASAVCVSHG